MFSYIRILSFIFLLVSNSVWALQQTSLPKRVQANYVVTKDGKAFANVREQFVITGKTYQVESVTKGIGVYALLGERKLISTGKVTAKGLQPQHFELHQGDNPKKTLFADFDWSKNTLRMLVKGEPRDAKLTTATQDLASFAYQFMFLPRPIKNSLTVKLTTGKKLNDYQYKVKPGLESLNVEAGQYKTLHLVPADQAEGKELWLAAEKHYLLVRFLMVDDDGAKLEQTLTELHVE